MKYRLIVLPGAKAEFEKIHGYMNERFGKKSAAHVKASYRKMLKSLRLTPRMNELVPERGGVHKCNTKSPTIVLYEVLEKEKRVEILTLYDGRFEQV